MIRVIKVSSNSLFLPILLIVLSGSLSAQTEMGKTPSQALSQTESAPSVPKIPPDSGTIKFEDTEYSPNDLIKKLYQKIQLYTHAVNVVQARQKSLEPDPGKDLHFSLDNIVTGPIDDIKDKPIGVVLTRPTGQTIHLTKREYDRPVTRNNPIRTNFIGYTAQWQIGEYTTYEDWEHTSIGEVMALYGPDFSDIYQYSSYDVLVQFDGRIRQYKALALYHRPKSKDQEPKVDFLDLIIGQGVNLNEILKEDKPLVGAVLNLDHPQNKNISDQKSFDQRPRTQNKGLACDNSGICCPSGYTSIGECCTNNVWLLDWLSYCSYTGGGGGGGGYDGGTGGDNSGGGELSCEESTATFSTSKASVNDAWHIWGNHSFNSELKSTCKYYSNCNAKCSFESPMITGQESGFVDGSKHIYSTSIKTADAEVTNARSNDTVCSGIAAGAVKSCLFGWCSVSISITGGVTGFTSNASDAFWNFENSKTTTCSKIQ